MKKQQILIIILLLAGIGLSFSPKINSAGNIYQQSIETGILKIINQPESNVFKPLQWIEISGAKKCVIVVYDGKGREYVRGNAGETLKFQIGGALGNHTVVLLNKKRQEVDRIVFSVDCKTEINDAEGEYNKLLNSLYWTMVSWNDEIQSFRYNGKFYHAFVRWLRDHVHALKGMKYFYHDLKSGIDLFADSQREDGMIWDNIYPRPQMRHYWDWVFEYDNFIMPIENSTYEFKRIPVEADVEYLFLEGLYYTWKATGDDTWMASRLDNAMSALKYYTTSEYRWSEKYQLLKRGYTIDTWDFQSTEDSEISGGLMVIDKDKTRFGVMFGDNTGLIVGCRYLAEMLEYAGRDSEAVEVRKLGLDIKQRLDKLAWNGEFYTHHVPEDTDIVRDFGVDLSTQVSLSNAYSLNRDITHEQCVAIIETYQRIRQEMPESSPGEWYTIYPPYERGFGNRSPKWEYMNAGVTPIVAGELAHGAFENGFEEYGVDILDRIKSLAEKTDNYLHCTYRGAAAEKPERSFETVDIKSYANVDFYGKGADGVPGDDELYGMVVGENVFHDIPFNVIDPAKNKRRACIGMSNAEGYAKQVLIPINKTAESIYFLHTNTGSNPAGTITLHYEDGTSFKDIISEGKIANWWMPTEPERPRLRMPKLKLAWSGRNNTGADVGIYEYGMNNPHPEKTIKSIELKAAENNAKWFMLGITLCDAPVFFDPGMVSSGIPDVWGAGAVVYALFEGLAGVKDEGVAFNKALLAPRWSAAEVNGVNATIKYEASGGYVCYDYKYDTEKQELDLQFTGTAEETKTEILIPANLDVTSLTLNGKKVNYTMKQVGKSEYVCLDADGPAVHHLKIYFSFK